MKRNIGAALIALLASPALAETSDEWVALGACVHGAFGSFIPLGIKIGMDATGRLTTKPRELSVTLCVPKASSEVDLGFAR
jgi:hypothetical protein